MEIFLHPSSKYLFYLTLLLFNTTTQIVNRFRSLQYRKRSNDLKKQDPNKDW